MYFPISGAQISPIYLAVVGFIIDIPERAMAARGHHRFADNVREISPDRKIPIQTHQPQRRPGDKTSAHTKKSTENADDEADNRQIDRANLRAGNRKIHDLLRAASQAAQQERGHTLEHDGLADDEKNGRASIEVAMVVLQTVQPAAQQMQNQKKIGHHEQRI